MADFTPVLYILARSDLVSLNLGKLAAQVSHATSMFHEEMHADDKHPAKALFERWTSEANGFGTCIVLDVATGDQVEQNIVRADVMIKDGLTKFQGATGICIDPTYPVRDGGVTHLIELVTCGYIFINKDDASLLQLDRLSLYH
jgi:peptidyl-tRNA hydrolase